MSVLEWMASIALVPFVIGSVISALVIVFFVAMLAVAAFLDWRDDLRRKRRRKP
jgi:hypothetical protein